MLVGRSAEDAMATPTGGSCCCLCNRPVPLEPGELELLQQASRCRLRGAQLTADQMICARGLKRLGYLAKSTRGGTLVLSITDRGRDRLVVSEPCGCPR